MPEPRSFLPFPLPLPSLRSDISPEKRTLCADRSRRRRRTTSLVRGLGSGSGKVCPSRGRARPSCGTRAARGRLLSPAGSGADAACGPGHLGLALAPSAGRPRSRGCSCRPGTSSVPAALGPAAVGCGGGVRPARSQPEEGEAFTVQPALPSPRQPPLLSSCPPREPGVPTSFGELLAGFFNCPTATHLPPAGWRLAPPSPPPLASPPPSSPPHPHPEARTRHREEPGLRAPGRSPFPSPSPAGRGAAARGTAAGKPRQGSLEAAQRRRRHRRRWKRTGRPREIQRPRKGPRGLLALLRCRAAPEDCSVPSSAERRWRESLELLTPAPRPQLRLWNPREGEELMPFFQESLGFVPFLL